MQNNSHIVQDVPTLGLLTHHSNSTALHTAGARVTLSRMRILGFCVHYSGAGHRQWRHRHHRPNNNKVNFIIGGAMVVVLSNNVIIKVTKHHQHPNKDIFEMSHLLDLGQILSMYHKCSKAKWIFDFLHLICLF